MITEDKSISVCTVFLNINYVYRIWESDEEREGKTSGDHCRSTGREGGEEELTSGCCNEVTVSLAFAVQDTVGMDIDLQYVSTFRVNFEWIHHSDSPRISIFSRSLSFIRNSLVRVLHLLQLRVGEVGGRERRSGWSQARPHCRGESSAARINNINWAFFIPRWFSSISDSVIVLNAFRIPYSLILTINSSQGRKLLQFRGRSGSGERCSIVEVFLAEGCSTEAEGRRAAMDVVGRRIDLKWSTVGHGTRCHGYGSQVSATVYLGELLEGRHRLLVGVRAGLQLPRLDYGRSAESGR